ncbi:hypothetical protein CXG81DRAFT_14160 [Caulochytrium protostelioides]|uniref:Translation initiation factor eIF2B subunit alpha n=1 Tax=Caulochytrium protostelioides TaxID=1555241 RepID=A0A4P9X3T7_9FUNG|nr:hypothetical protein CXG81DRAFT_14160 [Caulochytrium protostelioides]|eukprot:RKO99705.1 hypothetical protein CXG81DRAFT_14160 [Caulochytrium protostelioides]
MSSSTPPSATTTSRPAPETTPVGRALQRIQREHPNLSTTVAAIKTLTECIQISKAATLSELIKDLEAQADILKLFRHQNVAIVAACDLFSRFLRDSHHDVFNLDATKERIIAAGNDLVDKSDETRAAIARHAAKHIIQEDDVVLVHSYSRVVVRALIHARRENTRFKVIICEGHAGRGRALGHATAAELRAHGIPTALIPDTALGYVIDTVSFILVGAEGVVQNGGLVNGLGTFTIALVAKSASKPFYVMAESYKFVKLFPLTQYDLPFHDPALIDVSGSDASSSRLPGADYTPPPFITLIVTEYGAFSPGRVADVMIAMTH